MIHTTVFIAGGGPVGLTIAKALGARGVRCMVVEQRPTTTDAPKMDVTNGRSMELFRAIGIADQIRAHGVPEEGNFEQCFCTAFTGREIARVYHPTAAEMRRKAREINDGAQPCEAYLRISQIIVEPLLKKFCDEDPHVEVRFGWEFTDFMTDAAGVTATIVQADSGREETVRAQFMVSCEGAASITRKKLGIGLSGQPEVLGNVMIHFRSTDLKVLHHLGPAWHYFVGLKGMMVAQDDKEFWTYHAQFPPGMQIPDLDPNEALRDAAGCDFDFQLLFANPWTARALVADNYGSGRVFIAGDAAHQYHPAGGYGMNTGIGDAFDIAWKLAAVVQGWGGPHLLSSYSAERRPIGDRNRRRCLEHLADGRNWRIKVNSDLLYAKTDAGESHRREIAPLLLKHQDATNKSYGTVFGYRYENSPICIQENGSPPPKHDVDYLPNSWPGARAPSFFLQDGTALFDRFGPGFVLLRLGNGAPDGEGILSAAKKRGVPMRVVEVMEERVREVYERNLVLVRPDHHVAWRGNRQPDNPMAVIDQVRGATRS